MDDAGCKVFISFKNSDLSGNPTEDSKIADDLYKRFVKLHIPTFYSNITLLELGEAAYKTSIENNLDSASVLILVGTRAEFIQPNTAKWVFYEYNSFHSEMLAEAKKDAIIVPYLSPDIQRQDIPLSIRNSQKFGVGVDSPDKVVDFVVAHLRKTGKISADEDMPLFRPHEMSSYNPYAHHEHDRLKIQADNTRDADMPALRYAVQQLGKQNFSALDLGCAYGYVTRDRFSEFPQATVIGVDKSLNCVQFASEQGDKNISYYQVDVEDDSFAADMADIMRRHNIQKFDIIMATLVLHHLKDPVKTLRKLRKYLSDDGYIIVRGSDDGSVIAYGDEGNLVQKIIDKHLSAAASGFSDRRNGRKIYYQLYTSGYKHIKTFNYVKDIADKTFDERHDIFDERFAYRVNYFQNALAKDPDNMQLRNDVEWMTCALDMLEDLFGNESFWYQEVDFVCVAKKTT